MSNLAEIGQILKNAREDRGLSLEDASQATRISRRYLANLEEGNVRELPEPVYIRSFIRKYANYLGLSGEELTAQYEVDKPNAKTGSNAEGAHWGWLPLTATIILLVSLGIAWWISRPTPPPLPIQTESPIVPPASPSAVATGEAPATAGVPASPSALATETVPASPTVEASVSNTVSVTMQATADCWVETVADGKTVYSEVMKNGEKANWKAQKSIQVTMGNAAGALLWVNNKELGPQGKTGEVVTRVFTAKDGQ